MSGAELLLPTDPIPDIAPVAPDWTGYLTTRTKFEFFTRPALADDEQELGAFFDHLAPEDLRFRFLSAASHVSANQLAAMTNYDHRTTEHFLAYDRDRTMIFASAILAADSDLETAEVAMAILPAYKGRGASWALLEHISRVAKAKGIRILESLESRDHHVAIELEREMGFVATSSEDDPTLVLLRAELKHIPCKATPQFGSAS